VWAAILFHLADIYCMNNIQHSQKERSNSKTHLTTNWAYFIKESKLSDDLLVTGYISVISSDLMPGINSVIMCLGESNGLLYGESNEFSC